MNKKIVIIIICLGAALTACGSYKDILRHYQHLSGAAIDGGTEQVENGTNKDLATPSSAMGEIVSGSGIHSAENVTFDMQTAQYWIDRMNTPDKVLAGKEDIGKLNKDLKGRFVQQFDSVLYDLDLYDGSTPGYRLKEWMEESRFPLKPYYCSGEQLSAEKWQAYYQNCNYDGIADYNKVRYGVICERADVRALPTGDVISEEPDAGADDILQNTALAINEPVLILHESRDHEWYFVLAEEYKGWIPKKTAGVAKNRDAWQGDKFLVVTADRIYTKEIPGDELSGNYEFTMGTKLFLAENASWRDNGQNNREGGVYDSYVVKVPVRNSDGSLWYKLLSIPLGKDVTVGYMEYTRANVVRQAFKMLGNPYGWGGAAGERDCSSLIRDVYLCFGIRLPRDSSGLYHMSENVFTEDIKAISRSTNVKGLSEKEKIQKLMGAEPGAILQMPGHVMLYLGCENKNYYVLSARGGQFRRVMVNDLHAMTEDGKTWAEQLEAIISCY